MTSETASSGTQRAHADEPGLLQRIGGGIYRGARREFHRVSMSSLRGLPILLATIALSLTAVGLIMVLSASSVEQIAAGASPFTQVQRQAIFAVIGIVGMVALSFMPVTWYRNKWVMHSLLALALLMQVLVLAIGTTVNGNRNWIQFGGISIQPSELSKLLITLWMSWVLSQQGGISRYFRKAYFPLLFGFVPLVVLILLGHDVGTLIIYAMMLLGILWLAGMNYRGYLIALLAIVAGFGVMIMTSPNRIARIFGVLGQCEGSTCDQSQSGLAALATGGFWGVGLGRSRQKYNYLPEAHNDYIFAVIGEELGLLGTLLIVILYLALLYVCIRIILRTTDRFIALATGTIVIWIIGQASINIAMVTGMLPVIGVPLPFISYGGSSLISLLAATGVLIAFARQTPLQPIVADGSTTYYAGETPKERARRSRLGRAVETEQARLDAAGDDAGIDIYDLLAVFGLGPRAPQKGRSGSARQAATRRTGQARTTPRGRASANRRSGGESSGQRKSTRPQQNRQQSQPQRADQQGARRPQTTSASTPQPAQNKPQEKRESKLPPGLAPLKSIRRGREHRSGGPGKE